MKWLRAFDAEYWHMRAALGYPVPAWADRRFRLSAGNQITCGTCEAVRRYPRLHAAQLIKAAEKDNDAKRYHPQKPLSDAALLTIARKLPLSADEF